MTIWGVVVFAALWCVVSFLAIRYTSRVAEWLQFKGYIVYFPDGTKRMFPESMSMKEIGDSLQADPGVAQVLRTDTYQGKNRDTEGTDVLTYDQAMEFLRRRSGPVNGRVKESRADERPILGYMVVDLGAANPTFTRSEWSEGKSENVRDQEHLALFIHPCGTFQGYPGLVGQVSGEESGDAHSPLIALVSDIELEKLLDLFEAKIFELRKEALK